MPQLPRSGPSFPPKIPRHCPVPSTLAATIQTSLASKNSTVFRPNWQPFWLKWRPPLALKSASIQR
eukprot:864910-Rhodomonas_salina.1